MTAAIDVSRARRIDYRGQKVLLGARDFDVLLAHGDLAYKSPGDARERMHSAIDRDAVAVSESFALRYNATPGDTILVPTSTGPAPFEVAAVYFDYSDNQGRLIMDRQTFARHFDANSGARSLGVYLKDGVEPADARARLLRTLGPERRVVIATQGDIRREVIRIFDSTFVITYALEVIAMVVAALGILSTLTTLILDRRRATTVMSVLGAADAQIRRVVIVEAIILGGVSLFVGIAAGVLLSLLLVYVINVQSFGWTIQYHFPWFFVLQVSAGVLTASLLAGLYPALRAARGRDIALLREE